MMCSDSCKVLSTFEMLKHITRKKNGKIYQRELLSSKVVFRTFLAILKQIMKSYSRCITDCQDDFEKEKIHEKQILKLPSSV